MNRIIKIFAAAAVALLAVSCTEDNNGLTIPSPGGKTAAPESGDGNGNGSTTTQDPQLDTDAKLCKEEYLGQKPMIIAYLTEYTSASTLDASCVTHINYAHGRFVNPKTGDGGITIAGTDLLKKVVALKEKKPTLKVLLMIGGWGEHADGFSMMARDATKRTAFCQAVKAHIDNYNLDGVDIDWEYPNGGPSSNGKSSDDPKNFNLVLKELTTEICLLLARTGTLEGESCVFRLSFSCQDRQ